MGPRPGRAARLGRPRGVRGRPRGASPGARPRVRARVRAPRRSRERGEAPHARVRRPRHLFSWGANRDGQLGYELLRATGSGSGEPRQVTPRRVGGALRGVWVAGVSAANRHSAVRTRDGEVFAFGSNDHGQLGVFASASASTLEGTTGTGTTGRVLVATTGEKGSNASDPRRVEQLRPRFVTHVAAAKKHTLALTADGEVRRWGFGESAARRVDVASALTTRRRRAARKQTGVFLGARPARRGVRSNRRGRVGFLALTRRGVVLQWASGDLRPSAATTLRRVRGFDGAVVAVAAGRPRAPRRRTAATRTSGGSGSPASARGITESETRILTGTKTGTKTARTTVRPRPRLPRETETERSAGREASLGEASRRTQKSPKTARSREWRARFEPPTGSSPALGKSRASRASWTSPWGRSTRSRRSASFAPRSETARGRRAGAEGRRRRTNRTNRPNRTDRTDLTDPTNQTDPTPNASPTPTHPTRTTGPGTSSHAPPGSPRDAARPGERREEGGPSGCLR